MVSFWDTSAIVPLLVREEESEYRALADQWYTVSPSQTILSRSERLLRIHPLRAADALQLSAAILAAKDEPRDSAFHTSDSRLAQAAEKEGFTVITG